VVRYILELTSVTTSPIAVLIEHRCRKIGLPSGWIFYTEQQQGWIARREMDKSFRSNYSQTAQVLATLEAETQVNNPLTVSSGSGADRWKNCNRLQSIGLPARPGQILGHNIPPGIV
jgi:hypothetical protein